MGLDLTYQAGETSFTCRPSLADWQTLEVLREHVPAEVAVCFDTPDFGETVRISTRTFRDAAAAIEAFLAANDHLLPATYQVKIEGYILGIESGKYFAFNGGVSGLRVPGDPDHFYALIGGPNKLNLEKWAVGPDGNGVIVQVRDLRNETELQLENGVKVCFRKRRVKTTLLKALQNIVAFAGQLDADEVQKTIG